MGDYRGWLHEDEEQYLHGRERYHERNQHMSVEKLASMINQDKKVTLDSSSPSGKHGRKHGKQAKQTRQTRSADKGERKGKHKKDDKK